MGWTSCWEQSLGSKEELETLKRSQTWTRDLGAARTTDAGCCRVAGGCVVVLCLPQIWRPG